MKPCRRCGGEKPERVQGGHLCAACAAAKNAPRRCPGCNEPLQLYQRTCADCQRRRYEARLVTARKPCIRCGGPKEPRHSRLCESCREAERERRANLRKITPCPHADQLPGKRSVCAACNKQRRQARARARHRPVQVRYCRCGWGPLAKYQRACEECKFKSRREQRARWLAKPGNREKQNRSRREWAKRHPEYHREWTNKRHENPDLRARDLESQRLSQRMLRERRGLPLRPVAEIPGALTRQAAETSLPGLPLVLAMDGLARRETVRNPFAVGPDPGNMGAICDRAGVNERLVVAWRRFERDVRLDVAEDVLTRLGLFWWEVWTEETVRVPLFTVHEYVNREKSVRGVRRSLRLRVRSVPYGDAGPDRGTLSRIEGLMTGELVAA